MIFFIFPVFFSNQKIDKKLNYQIIPKKKKQAYIRTLRTQLALAENTNTCE